MKLIHVAFTQFELEVVENWLSSALNGADSTKRTAAVERARAKMDKALETLRKIPDGGEKGRE